MRTKFRKITATFLALIMALGVLTVAPFTVSAASCVKTQADAVNWLREQEGKRYNLDNVYGSQCSDFSSAYINYVLYGDPWAKKFGVYDANKYSNKSLYPSDWQVFQNTLSFVPQPGDIFITQGNTSFGHTGVVISSTVNNATIVDQNGGADWSLDYGSPAHIRNITWTGSGTWCPKYFIRPKFANTAHVHNYNTYVYYWKDHPHYKCYKCSCGDIKENTNEQIFVTTCEQCWQKLGGSPLDLGDTFTAKIKHIKSGKYIVGTSADNVEIAEKGKSTYDIWKFERQSDSTYRIQNIKSGKYLDLEWGNQVNGSNIQIYESNISNSQKWYIVKNGDAYSILFKTNPAKAVDVTNDLSTDGTNIQIWDKNTSPAQIFQIEEYVPISPPKLSVSTNENDLIFSMNCQPGVENYTLKIWKGSADNGEPFCEDDSISYQTSEYVMCDYKSIWDPGEYEAYLYANNDGEIIKSNLVTFTVNQQIIISPNEAFIDLGDTYWVDVYTDDGWDYYIYDGEIIWSTSDSTVATVDKRGIVTAVSPGKAIITAKTLQGEEATCTFTVNEPLHCGIKDITFIKLPSKTFTKEVKPEWFVTDEYGDTYLDNTLSGVGYIEFCNDYLINKNMQGAEIKVSFDDGTSENFTFRGNCSPVGSAEEGHYTFGENEDIFITVEDLGNYQARIKLYNYSKTFTVNHATSAPLINITPDNISLNVGDTYKLTAQVNEEASPDEVPSNKLTWKSSNTSVATVLNGTVTAKAEGTATITAETSNGNKAECIVTVKDIDTNTPQIVVSNKTGKNGEDVVVNISFKNNPGITAFKFNVAYDSNALELKNAEAIGINALYSENLSVNPFVISWENGIQNVPINGDFIKLTFSIKDNAAEGHYPISVTYDEEDIFNIKEQNVYFNIINGSVKIASSIPGDINQDGSINMKDLTRLHQYVNGWNVPVDKNAIDVNGDGNVNMKDLTRLHQYINGWKVDIYIK